jgi:hypothetical protein
LHESIENSILSIYFHLTGNPPSPQTILSCDINTNKEQISAFLYRCFTLRSSAKRKEGVLFSIINYEKLSESLLNHFEETLLSLQDDYKRNFENVLAVFTSSRESQFNHKEVPIYIELSMGVIANRQFRLHEFFKNHLKIARNDFISLDC